AAISRREERSILEERERREPISLPPTLSIQPPVEGKISKVQRGIEIYTTCSAPVRAVDSGRVIYSGGDLQAYGNMVIIEHDRFISLYAYNESNLVKRGDRVSKGQIIARVGKKNNSDECVLRFEIRNKEGIPLDPTEYMNGLQ
ncbi:MAG: murein hydrolase activator EnvC family protein, partial [Aquificaceae bacterium]